VNIAVRLLLTKDSWEKWLLDWRKGEINQINRRLPFYGSKTEGRIGKMNGP